MLDREKLKWWVHLSGLMFLTSQWNWQYVVYFFSDLHILSNSKTKWLCIDFYGRYLSVLIWLHILIRVLKNMSLNTYLHNVGILSVVFVSCKQNSGRPSLHNCSYYRLKTTSQRSRSGKCYRIKQNIITLIFASSYLLLNW